jgi:hypothetical protein
MSVSTTVLFAGLLAWAVTAQAADTQQIAQFEGVEAGPQGLRFLVSNAGSGSTQWVELNGEGRPVLSKPPVAAPAPAPIRLEGEDLGWAVTEARAPGLGQLGKKGRIKPGALAKKKAAAAAAARNAMPSVGKPAAAIPAKK